MKHIRRFKRPGSDPLGGLRGVGRCENFVIFQGVCPGPPRPLSAHVENQGFQNSKLRMEQKRVKVAMIEVLKTVFISLTILL